MRLRSVLSTGTLVLSFGVLAPSLTGAIGSWQGDDYSWDIDSRRQLKTCDQEADGKDVHGDYKRADGGQSQVTDTDGANGRCAYSVWYTSPILEHRTCEEGRFLV